MGEVIQMGEAKQKALIAGNRREMETVEGADAHTGTPPHIRRAELFLANHMLLLLNKMYPGYGWSATVSVQQGLVWFSIPALMGDLADIEHLDNAMHPEFLVKWLKIRGGEILERFRLRRGKIDLDQMSEARAFKRMLNRHQKLPE